MQNGSPIAQRIIEIQKEVKQINVHQREHVTNSGGMQLDRSCRYCQVSLSDTNWITPHSELPVDGVRHADTMNELERTVDLAGKKGQVSVPRNWVGKRVKIVLL